MEHHEFIENARVVDRNGADIGTFVAVEEGQEGAVILARMQDGNDIEIPYEHVDHDASSEDRIVTDLAVASLDRDVSAETAPDATLPLSEEQLDLSTRWAERGRVVIRKRVETVPQEKTVELAQEGVEVERVPVNEVVDALPQVRTEGETTIIPVIEEVLVVEKRYRLVEEVRVTSTRTTRDQTIREDLRREVLEFEEVPTEDSGELR